MTTEFKHMLEKMDLHQIEKLKQAKQAITYLEGRRRQLVEQLAVLDEQLAALKEGRLEPSAVLPKPAAPAPAPAVAAAPRRRKSGQSLPSKIVEVLQGKPDGLSVTEIAQAVLATGHETTAKNFRVLVGINVGKMPELERIGHGIYRLKAVPAGPTNPS